MFLMIWLIICVFAIWLVVLWKKYEKKFQQQNSYTSCIPHWPTVPILGNAHNFIGASFFHRALEATKLAEAHNGRFKAWMGPQFVLTTSNPADIKIITNTFVDKPYYYHFSRIWIGHGLATAPVNTWKQNIKYLAGTFTGSVVDGFQDIFNAQAQKIVSHLKTEVGNPPFDALQKYFAFATLETICQTALGTADIDAIISPTDYYNAFNNAMELLAERGRNILYHTEFVYKLTPEYRKLKKYVQTLHSVSNYVIAKRRKEYKEIKDNRLQDVNEESSFKTYLDILLDLSESSLDLSDEQIRAEVDTIIVGGQETNATTLSFMLLMLGSNPEIQDKVFSEIADVFEGSDRPVDKDDLPKLKYCEAVINETLRLYPPVPFVMRYADKQLDMDDYIIPENTICMVSIWGTGRSKQIWGENALEFKPERWLNKEMQTSACFTPFSYGRRACIGRKYALAFLKTLLVWCVRDLIIKSDTSHLELNSFITLRATSGHLLSVDIRN